MLYTVYSYKQGSGVDWQSYLLPPPPPAPHALEEGGEVPVIGWLDLVC
jgi:hypothetical protein